MLPCTRSGVILFLFYFTALSGVSGEYKTVYLEDTCNTDEVLRVYLGANEIDTARIIKASREPTSLPNRNCSIHILPPLGHGVTLSVRYLNMNPNTEPQCENYILITDLQDKMSKQMDVYLCGQDKMSNPKEVCLCGHSDDPTEYESYSSDADLFLLFHTGNSNHVHSYFTFVATAYTQKLPDSQYCPLNGFQCSNSHCIWKGLTCDGHNNCGDQSDERNFSPSYCEDRYHDGFPAGVIIGISLGSLLVFLLVFVLPLVYCCVRLKNQRKALDEERRTLYASLRREGTAVNRNYESGAMTSPHTQSS